MASSRTQEGTRRRPGTDYKALLLDIEGTTTPISFVKDVLFPYSCGDRLEVFFGSDNVAEAEAEVRDRLLASLREQARVDRNNEGQSLPSTLVAAASVCAAGGGLHGLVEYVRELIRADKKVPALKELQGRLWREGYESGELRGAIFPEVRKALAAIAAQSVPIFLYSSGSVPAQRLLFGFAADGEHSVANLLPLFSGFFDTVNAGPKQEPSSYRKISALVTDEVFGHGVARPRSAGDVLFVTDVLAEAQAARESGMQAVLSVRPGNAPLPTGHGMDEITTLFDLV